MKTFSYTSALGYARLLVILAGFLLVATGRMSLLDATASVVAFIGILGSVGLVKSKDADSPDAQINVRQVGEEIRIEATAQEPSPQANVQQSDMKTGEKL